MKTIVYDSKHRIVLELQQNIKPFHPSEPCILFEYVLNPHQSLYRFKNGNQDVVSATKIIQACPNEETFTKYNRKFLISKIPKQFRLNRGSQKFQGTWISFEDSKDLICYLIIQGYWPHDFPF